MGSAPNRVRTGSRLLYASGHRAAGSGSGNSQADGAKCSDNTTAWRALSVRGKITGEVKQDETGWHEVRLIIPVHGPKGDATVRVSGGREDTSWKYTTFEVLMPQLKKKADLVTGRIVEYSPDAYVDIHTQATGVPEYISADVPPPQW